MTLTVAINPGATGLTLCHKASNGISTATLPDVCNTPAPPVPVPYPNIALSSDLIKGTTTVAADGGNMCANFGSEFAKSTGDEPGVAGGVASGTFIKEATWITYSFDVKLEGKGVCRLTDKMFHNHQNTVNTAGVAQLPRTPGDIQIINCILEMCKKDKDVVAKAKRLKISVENSRQMGTFEYQSSGVWAKINSWPTAGTANPSTREVTITRGQPCSEIQRSIFHEVRHTEPVQKGMSGLDAEIDAYTVEEDWAIARRMPESPSNFRKTLPDGSDVPDTDRLKAMLKEKYGFNLKGGPQVRGTSNGGKDVWLDNKTTRQAQVGDRYSKMDPPNQNLDPKDISPDSLKCP